MLPKLKLTVLTAMTCLLISPSAQASLEDNLKHIPAQADAVMNLQTSKDAWAYFMKRKAFSNWVKSIGRDLSPDLHQNLGPFWEEGFGEDLGSHMSVAFWGLNQEAQFVFVQDLNTRKSFDELIKSLSERAEADENRAFNERKYAGSTLYDMDNGNGVFSMALDGLSLIAGPPAAVEAALNTGTGKRASIAQGPQYKAVHDELKNEKIFFYLRPQALPNMMKMAEEAAKSRAELVELRQAEQELRDSMAAYDSLGFSLDLSPNGLVFKSVSKIKTSGLKGKQKQVMQDFIRIWGGKNEPLSELLSVSPRRPLVFTAMDGLDLMGKSMAAYMPQDKETKQVMAQLERTFSRMTNVSSARWMAHSNGKAGLAVFYPELAKRYKAPPHVVMFYGVKNSGAFQDMLFNDFQINLNALQDLVPKPTAKNPNVKITATPMANMPPLRFRPDPIEYYSDRPIYMMEDNALTRQMRQEMSFEPAVTHVDNLWIFGSSPEALKATLDFSEGFHTNLLGNRYFNRLKTVHRLEERASLFFMDTTSLIKMLNGVVGQEADFQLLKPSLEAIRGVVAGGNYKNQIATGVLAIDIDMDRVDFQLIADLMQRATANIRPGLEADGSDTLDESSVDQDFDLDTNSAEDPLMFE